MSNLDSLVDDFYGSNKPAAAKPAAQAGAAGIDANDNVRRFLDFLGQAEGADYDVLVGGSRFDDFSRHPNIVGLRTAEGPSTAAGKYQITGTTYRDFAPRLGINDFSPESQDRLALAIIESEGALEDVQAGNFDAAIQKLGGRWAVAAATIRLLAVAGRRTLILLLAGRRCHARIDAKNRSSVSPACSTSKWSAGTNRSQLAQKYWAGSLSC